MMSGGVFLEVFVDMCISCFSVFHPLWLGLVPHCEFEYLLLGVDVVCHCFCSPCCDLCAAAWVTLEGKVLSKKLIVSEVVVFTPILLLTGMLLVYVLRYC